MIWIIQAQHYPYFCTLTPYLFVTVEEWKLNTVSLVANGVFCYDGVFPGPVNTVIMLSQMPMCHLPLMTVCPLTVHWKTGRSPSVYAHWELYAATPGWRLAPMYATRTSVTTSCIAAWAMIGRTVHGTTETTTTPGRFWWILQVQTVSYNPNKQPRKVYKRSSNCSIHQLNLLLPLYIQGWSSCKYVAYKLRIIKIFKLRILTKDN